MITEACLLFGWLPDYCLAMPARRFFAMLDSGRKLKTRSDAVEHVALCDVSSIALGDVNYFNKVRDSFRDRALGIDRSAPRKVLDPTDPATVRLVENLTLQASRMH